MVSYGFMDKDKIRKKERKKKREKYMSMLSHEDIHIYKCLNT